SASATAGSSSTASTAAGRLLQVGDQLLQLLRGEGLAEVLRHHVRLVARGDHGVRVADRLGDLLRAHSLQGLVEVGPGGARRTRLREGVAAAAVAGEEL